MQQDDDHEESSDREQDRGRVAGDAEPGRDRVQPVSPQRERQQDEPGEQPEQRVALAEPAAADQLEDGDQQDDGRDRADDRDPERGHLSSRGTTLRRKSPTKIASSTLTM